MKTKIKTIRIIFLLMIAFSACIGNTNAQLPNDGKFNHDPAPFIGKWEARSENQTFVLIIEKGELYIDGVTIKQYIDQLFGEMIYMTDGEITRHVKVDGINSIFCGTPSKLNSSVVNFRFTDNERKMAGTGVFRLDPNNPQKATWELRGIEWPQLRGEGWNKVGFGIPRELEWTKIE